MKSLLQKFCATDLWKKNCGTPYSIGEFTYATNGHIVIRVPRLPDVSEVEGAPNAVALDWSVLDTDQWIEIPQFAAPKDEEKVDCEHCRSTGLEHECPDCSCECPDCRGTGSVMNIPTQRIKIGSKKVASDRYLTLLKELPGILIAPDAKCKGPREPIPFKFDGGEGLLMPMRGEND